MPLLAVVSNHSQSIDRMLLRSRLYEQYQRVIREDMLTLFNHTAELKSLECSIVLDGVAMMRDELKYRAACVLELLTGQRATAINCIASQEDPLKRNVSIEDRKQQDRVRSAMLLRQAMPSKDQPSTMLKAADFKSHGTALQLKTTLRSVNMFYFLEKCREFYLPDVVGLEELASDERGHSNEGERAAIAQHFERWATSKSTAHPSRMPIPADRNPTEAVSTYILRSSDLLKFPDIELHFEALGPALGSIHQKTDDNLLHLVLRPTVAIGYPITKEAQRSLPPVDNLRVMNYLLSLYFNPYMHRPKLYD